MFTIYNVMLVASRAFGVYNYESRPSTQMLPDSDITGMKSTSHLHLITLVPLTDSLTYPSS